MRDKRKLWKILANYKRYEQIIRDTINLWKIRKNYKRYEQITQNSPYSREQGIVTESYK
jgi:hypothetical protein